MLITIECGKCRKQEPGGCAGGLCIECSLRDTIDRERRDLSSLRAAVEALAVRVAPLGRASGEIRWSVAQDLRALLLPGGDASRGTGR